jgi:predicted DNA-binding transcriptional regulator AlpA
MDEKLEPYIDTKQLMELLPISEQMIRKMCRDPKNPLPHVRLGDRYAFLWSRVSAWLDSREIKSPTLS